MAAELIAGTVNKTTTIDGTANSRTLVAGRHVDVEPDRVSTLNTQPAPAAANTPSNAHTESAKPGRSTPSPAITHTPTVRDSNHPATANPLTATTAFGPHDGLHQQRHTRGELQHRQTTKMFANTR